MNTNATAITVLGKLLQSFGVDQILVSPGSRNAPIVLAFKSMGCFSMHSIVDERSAAFIGLGIALKTQKPVALICTSGSAALNFAPGIAEAFYQKVPLIAITADRPAAWIDQLEGQTINQINLFKNYIRKSINLPTNYSTSEDLAYLKRLINQCLINTIYPVPGPVHINVPLREPLYEKPLLDANLLDKELTIKFHQPELSITSQQKTALSEVLSQSTQPMIIIGQLAPDNGLSGFLEKLEQEHRIVLLTEHTSNVSTPGNIGSIDRTLEGMIKEELYSPDLLITMGEAIVSKKIKRWLIDFPPNKHIHITEDASGKIVDTFQSISDTIIANFHSVLDYLSSSIPEITEKRWDFFKRWTQLSERAKERHQSYLQQTEYSDLLVFEKLFKHIPKGAQLHLANSSPVRYAQLFDIQNRYQFHSNRGVSGIDGSISTAVGYASSDPENTNTIITGELGFLYDSNALFNKIVTDNLVIIVINNGGGNIFKIIPGPTDFEGSEELIIFDHSFKCKGIAENFGIAYSSIHSIDEMDPILTDVYLRKKAHLIEIFTPEDSSETLKNYFKFIKT